MLMEKAKQNYDKMKITVKCEYSERWLQWFKSRLGICQLKTNGEQLSAEKEAVEKYVMEFEKISGRRRT